MLHNLMQLKILLPFRVFADKPGVKRIVSRTTEGFIGFLPNRLDCALALTPGILTWESVEDGDVFVAVDEGILVKTGPNVLVSVRNAIAGNDLETLHQRVLQEFVKESKQEKDMRFALARLESGFIHRFLDFQHG